MRNLLSDGWFIVPAPVRCTHLDIFRRNDATHTFALNSTLAAALPLNVLPYSSSQASTPRNVALCGKRIFVGHGRDQVGVYESNLVLTHIKSNSLPKRKPFC